MANSAERKQEAQLRMDRVSKGIEGIYLNQNGEYREDGGQTVFVKPRIEGLNELEQLLLDGLGQQAAVEYIKDRFNLLRSYVDRID